MPFFTKKPVRIEARQITDETSGREISDWIMLESPKSNPQPHFSDVKLTNGEVLAVFNGIIINTLEGPLLGRVGWWVIKGVKGEFYACEPDIFELTYNKEPTFVKR